MPKKNLDTQYALDTQQQVEKNTTAIQLITQSLDYMQKGVNEIKESILSLRNELKDGFVTKEQFERLKADVLELKNLRDLAVKIVISSVILALLALLGLNR